MNNIEGRSKTVRELLDGEKYSVGYYQREYKWGRKNIAELIEDLETKFLSKYDEKHERPEVQNYPNYFLGSIIISHKEDNKYIIDGQQRLTSLTLLLIYLDKLQKELFNEDYVENLSTLIFSKKYGKKSFNLNVPNRSKCLESLYKGENYDPNGKSESIQNIIARYSDIEELFPESLKNKALLYFIDWLRENVVMVEITAYSDDDAYTIFETMNDRGLSLNPTDMLKGYLLANISDFDSISECNELWKYRILELIKYGKNEETDFFKAWLRAKYADSIRETKKGAINKDFEKIGTEFHKWIRDNKEYVGLNSSEEFQNFIEKEFDTFSRHYIKLLEASNKLTPGFESIFYNAYNNFTFQYPLIISSIRQDDDEETVNQKIKLVADYLDNFIVKRFVNFRTLNYSSIKYTMFNLMKEIRNLDLTSLSDMLQTKLKEMPETLDGVNNFFLHQQNRRYVHYFLARITSHIENQCGTGSNFELYVSRDIKKPFEIEHILPDKYERYTEDFDTQEEFEKYRNNIGNLILIPKGFNQSLGSDEYEEKVKHYYGQNLIAKSLNSRCYKKNPSFLYYINKNDLPFSPYQLFKKDEISERAELYRTIGEEIWNVNHLIY
ncbi:DUF262 domain-containing protein [Methanohalophilus sp.]